MQKFQTKLKELWEKVKGFFAKLNKKTRILLAVCLAVVLVLVVAASVRLNRKEYAVLCTGLTAAETSNVIQFLNDSGVTDYLINNDEILVPANRQVQLQGQLATSGKLNTGFLYEFYTENVGSFSTEAERKEAARIAMEQKLAAVIRTFEGVQDADVMLNLGTDRVYVLQDNATPATAAVTVHMDGGQELSAALVEGIRSTVSHGVEGLDIKDVSIVDGHGTLYSDNNTMSQISEANALKLQVEQTTNAQVRSQVLEALGRIYGRDNVTVGVTCTADVDRRMVETTSYHQPEGSAPNGGLIGRQQYFWEVMNDGNITVGGTIGTTTNSDLNVPIYPEITANLDDDQTYAAGSGEIDSKIDTVVEQKEVLAATITDVSLAVTINQSADNSGTLTVDELTRHVAVAAGIGMETDEFIGSRVSVVIAPFADDTAGNGGGGSFIELDPWVLYAAIAGLVLFVVLLIIILLLARKRKKKKLAKQQALEEEMREAEAAAEAAAILAAAPPTGGADIMEINTEKSMELRKNVRQFAQNNPEIAAQMIRAWLKGEDGGA